MFYLVTCYENGGETEKNLEKALNWYQKYQKAIETVQNNPKIESFWVW